MYHCDQSRLVARDVEISLSSAVCPLDLRPKRSKTVYPNFSLDLQLKNNKIALALQLRDNGNIMLILVIYVFKSASTEI